MSYLLFMDESGHDRRNLPYEVRGGIALEDGKIWPFARTGAGDVLTPGGQGAAAFLDGNALFVGDVVHFAAEGIERSHAFAFGLRQEHERERQVRGAFARDGAAFLHGHWAGGDDCAEGEAGGLSGSSGFGGGRPPVSLKVGLRPQLDG